MFSRFLLLTEFQKVQHVELHRFQSLALEESPRYTQVRMCNRIIKLKVHRMYIMKNTVVLQVRCLSSDLFKQSLQTGLSLSVMLREHMNKDRLPQRTHCQQGSKLRMRDSRCRKPTLELNHGTRHVYRNICVLM